MTCMFTIYSQKTESMLSTDKLTPSPFEDSRTFDFCCSHCGCFIFLSQMKKAGCVKYEQSVTDCIKERMLSYTLNIYKKMHGIENCIYILAFDDF